MVVRQQRNEDIRVNVLHRLIDFVIGPVESFAHCIERDFFPHDSPELLLSELLL